MTYPFVSVALLLALVAPVYAASAPVTGTVKLEVPPGAELKITRRKGNTSKQILLTVNKDTVVEQVVSPPPKPPPPPPVTQSPDGTRGQRVVDAAGGVWTLGPGRETLRDGIHMQAGFGFEYRMGWRGVPDGRVYVKGTDSLWYVWDGARWSVHSTVDPDAPVTPPVVTPPSPPSPLPPTSQVICDALVWANFDGHWYRSVGEHWYYKEAMTPPYDPRNVLPKGPPC